MNMKTLRPLIETAVAQLHNSSHLLYILETGVTGHLLHDIWRMPGSSNTILYYGFPYHRRVQQNLLGDCTAKRKNSKKSLVKYREEQGVLTDLVVLNAILWATGIKQIPLSDVIESDQIQKIDDVSWILKPDDATHRPENLFDHVFLPTGELIPVEAIDPNKYILFPGSFDPLSFAHVEMGQVIEQMTGKKVIYQISQQHPMKADEGIPEEDLRKRFLQFQYRHPVLFLRGDGLYVDKAKKIPGIKILLGADAAKHLLNPKFYGGDVKRRQMLEGLAEIGSSFLVMGRVDKDTGDFITRDDLDMPPRFAHVFEGVSSRWDISSTQIRAQQGCS